MRAYEFLVEGKLDKVWKDWGDRILACVKADRTFPMWIPDDTTEEEVNQEIIQQYNEILTEADPSKNQDYCAWITRLYINRKFFGEDIPNQVHDALVKYHRMKLSNQLPDPRYKDINFFKSLSELTAILPESGAEVVSDKGKYKVLADDSTVLVVQLLDAQSGVYFGQGTNPTWCTAYPLDDPRNQWDTYKDDGPIYVIIPKVNKNHPNEKYQWQFNSQLTNRKNEWIEESELRELLQKCPVVKELFHDEVINNENVFLNYKVEFGNTFAEQKEIITNFINNNDLYDEYGRNQIAFWLLPEAIQNDTDVIKLALKKDSKVFNVLSNKTIINPEIVNYMVTVGGELPKTYDSKRPNYNEKEQDFIDRVLNDKDLMLNSLYHDPDGYYYISERLKQDPDIRSAVICLVYRNIPNDLNADLTLQETILALLSVHQRYVFIKDDYYDNPIINGITNETIDIEDANNYLRQVYKILSKFGDEYSTRVKNKIEKLNQVWREIATR